MLERVWKEGSPPTLPVGMKTGKVTMEKSMGFLKNSKNLKNLQYDPAIPL